MRTMQDWQEWNDVDWELKGARAAAGDIHRWAMAAVKSGRPEIRTMIREALTAGLRMLNEPMNQGEGQ